MAIVGEECRDSDEDRWRLAIMAVVVDDDESVVGCACAGRSGLLLMQPTRRTRFRTAFKIDALPSEWLLVVFEFRFLGLDSGREGGGEAEAGFLSRVSVVVVGGASDWCNCG